MQTSIEHLHETASALGNGKHGLAIGCTLEFSCLVLLPVFSRLKRFLGEEVAARVVIYDCDMPPLLEPAELDIVVGTWVADTPVERDAVKIFDGEVVPVASPAFLERHGTAAMEHAARWRGVPRLEIGRRSPRRTSWEAWFEAHGWELPDAPVETFENLVYLLRAAAEGAGIGHRLERLHERVRGSRTAGRAPRRVAANGAVHLRRSDADGEAQPRRSGLPARNRAAGGRAVHADADSRRMSGIGIGGRRRLEARREAGRAPAPDNRDTKRREGFMHWKRLGLTLGCGPRTGIAVRVRRRR